MGTTEASQPVPTSALKQFEIKDADKFTLRMKNLYTYL